GGFFGIGAYGVALMTLRGGLSFWIALPLAGLISAVIGFLIGLPALRTKGSYFAISSLCFGVIIYIVAGAWINFTGGYTGLVGIPTPSPIPFPFLGEISFRTQTSQYYLVLAFLLLTLWAMHRVVYSLQGYNFMAIRNNETLAEAVGINSFRNKMIAFVVSNFFVAIAGGLWAPLMGSISPSATHFVLTFNFIIMLLLGGIATLAGPIIGAFTIPFLMDSLHPLGHFRLVFFGALLIVVMIYFQRGLMGWLTNAWHRGKNYYEQRKGGKQNAAKG
ncbi:MAG TPA: branched-chain amino acid ABC transporter permease, partial [Candidatus Limnocylindrales bacterium]|nr:branched-chain amino acid ABC transporter permease [Candidatus Limnocylindrales bacterium]